MKKIALLPISMFAALAITACGDSESSNPVTPEGGSQPALSSEALPGSSETVPTSSATVPGSSETVTPGSSEAAPTSSASLPASSATVTPVEFTTEAVAAPEINCTTEALTFAAGVKVTCDEKFAGNILEDDDPNPFNEAAVTNLDFTGIQKIYAGLQATDKVVFLMRHAHRTSSTDASGVLTGLGYLQAKAVGEKIKGDEEIKYWHSEIPRTEQTCKAIAWGRGQTEISHVALADLNGGWFEKDHAKIEEYAATLASASTYEVVSRWVYGEYEGVSFDEGYYDLTERANQFINEIVLGKIAPQSRISIVISHDQMLYPLAVFAANKQIDMRFYGDTKNWLNFLAGLAVIVKPDNTTKIVLLKGLDTGYQD